MEETKALAKQSDITEIIEQDKIDKLLEGEKRIRKQNFLKIIHQDPLEMGSLQERIKIHPVHESPYIPISIIEMMLDQLFFGEWETINYRTKRVMNEIVGDIELRVVHPVTGRQMTRTGSAAVAIQQDKGASVHEIEKKKMKALEKNYPSLKSEAIKNAAKSFGRIFGRDLGRNPNEKAGDYSPMMSEEQEGKVHQSLADVVDKAKAEKEDNGKAQEE